MAITQTITFGSTANLRPYGVLTVTETGTDISGNTSTLSINLTLKRPSNISSSATKTASCTINGTKYTWAGSIGGVGDKTLISKTQKVVHNNDGNKNIALSASIDLNITWGGVPLGTISGTGDMELTPIPRYASANQNLNNKTETTITMNWSSDSIIDYIWYSTNNGNTWVGINVTDGKSGSYTINALTANTNYMIKTRVRKKGTGLTTETDVLSVDTYAYPYCTSMPSLTIGSKLTLGFFNPLNRLITVNIIGADGSQISENTTDGTTISGYNDEMTKNRFYASIPNAKSGTYRVRVRYVNQVNTRTGGTYTVNESECLPNIGVCSYLDTNSACTGLTGDNQKIIRNQSTVTIDASGITGQKGAQVSSCEVIVNAEMYSMVLSGDTATVSNIVIDSANNTQAQITVTDSRGLEFTKSLDIKMIDWELPTAIINLKRRNNFYSESDINVNANYASIDGANVVTIRARSKKVGDTSYSSYVNLQNNITSTLTLDNEYAWDVQVLVADAFGQVTYNLTLSRGMPIVFFDNIKSSAGFNCFPIYEKSVEVNGLNIEKSAGTAYLSASITGLAVNTYTIIPFDLSNMAGSRLSFESGGGIKIGSGITKVLVSGATSFDTIQSNGRRHIRVVKNSYSSANTLAWSWSELTTSSPGSVIIAPIVATVASGDIIYMCYYTPNANDQIGGNADGCRTSLTIQTIY